MCVPAGGVRLHGQVLSRLKQAQLSGALHSLAHRVLRKRAQTSLPFRVGANACGQSPSAQSRWPAGTPRSSLRERKSMNLAQGPLEEVSLREAPWTASGKVRSGSPQSGVLTNLAGRSWWGASSEDSQFPEVQVTPWEPQGQGVCVRGGWQLLSQTPQGRAGWLTCLWPRAVCSQGGR